MLLGCYLSGFSPHLIEAVLTLTPRSNIAVWSVLAVVFIVACQPANSTRTMETVVTVSLAVLLLANICVMTDMAANERAVNTADFVEAEQIAERIYAYEEETGNVVKKIATAGDENVTYYRPESRYRNSQLGARILCTNYSDYRLIGYTMGRAMEKAEMPEEIFAQYFAGKDWDSLNVLEQTVCMGDTLYLAVY